MSASFKHLQLTEYAVNALDTSWAMPRGGNMYTSALSAMASAHPFASASSRRARTRSPRSRASLLLLLDLLPRSPDDRMNGSLAMTVSGFSAVTSFGSMRSVAATGPCGR